MKPSPSFLRYVFTLLGGFVLFLSSCINKIAPEWDTQILSPIVRSTLTIQNLTDSLDFVVETSDQSLSLIYSDLIYTLESPLDSFVDLAIEPYENTLTLQALELAPQQIADSIFLGDFRVIPNPPNGTITLNDGADVAFLLSFLDFTIPGFNNEVDISEFLVEAYPSQAFLDIRIENQTDFEILNLDYSIRNADDGLVLFSGVIDTIKSRSVFTDLNNNIKDQIGNEAVKGVLDIGVNGLSLGLPKGQRQAFFNYSDFLAFDIALRDILVDSALAQFPAQQIINFTDVVDIQTDGDAELTFARIDTGIVTVTAFSSIPTDLNFEYLLPNVSRNGEKFSFSTTVDDSFNSSLNQKDTNFFFSQYDFDMTVRDGAINREFNSFLNTIVGDIAQTDGIIGLSLADTIGIRIEISKIKPSYARGYLGTETIQIKDTARLDLDLGFDANLDFNEVNLALEVENEIGIAASVLINELTAINSKTGEKETYTGFKGPFTIEPGLEVGLGFRATKSILTLTNSENLLSITPDQLVYDLTLIANPGAKSYTNFIHQGASLKANINVNVPLNISTDALTLSDTIAFRDSTDQFEVPDELQDGTFSLLIDNGFPFDAQIKVFFLNQEDIVLDSLSSPNKVLSANLDFNTGIVTSSVKSRLDYPLSKNRLETMLGAEKMIVQAILNTPPGVSAQIYSFYGLSFQLVGDFGYRLKTKF